jgi:hypothetical protein
MPSYSNLLSLLTDLLAVKCEQAWACFAVFIYGLFNDALSSFDYIDRMVSEC